MKHPIEKCNLAQAKFLAECPADQRRFYELGFTVGNAIYVYHQMAHDLKPTAADWTEWLEGLPEPIQAHMRERGFDDCKKVLSFSRYVLEKHDQGLDQFLVEKLGPDLVAEYQQYLK